MISDFAFGFAFACLAFIFGGVYGWTECEKEQPPYLRKNPIPAVMAALLLIVSVTVGSTLKLLGQ